MNWLDLVIVTGIVWGGWSGWRRGLVRELCQTGAAVLALVLAVRYSAAWAVGLTFYTGLSLTVSQSVAFAALLLGVAGLGYVLFPYVERSIGGGWGAVRIERWGGLLVGGLKGAALAFILILFAAQLPWFPIQDAVNGSFLALQMLDAAPTIYESVRTILPRPPFLE